MTFQVFYLTKCLLFYYQKQITDTESSKKKLQREIVTAVYPAVNFIVDDPTGHVA